MQSFDDPQWHGDLPEVSIWRRDGHMRTLHEIESDVIKLAIVHYGGNCSVAAQRLGMSRTNLYRRMKELGITPPAIAERILQSLLDRAR